MWKDKSALVTGSTSCIGLGIATPITCNAICPGHVKTPLIKGQIKKNQAKGATTCGRSASYGG